MLENKYKKWYDQIIQNANNRTIAGYVERHHIIPKCLGGSNLKENIAVLTAREHFICHRLLYKMHTGKTKAKMAYAFKMMCSANNQHNRVITSRDFALARKYMSESCTGDNNSNFGNKLPDLEREKIRSRQTGNKNSMYGKIPWNKNKKLKSPSNETKSKISKSLMGHVVTEETKEKLSVAHTGKKLSAETKEKLRQLNLGKRRNKESIEKGAAKLRGKKQKLITCPHCGKEGGTTMYRWHFNNCKLRGDSDEC